MNIDLNTPVIQSQLFPQRDEVFIVSFEGFIKNPSEGLIRFMKEDRSCWIERYPGLLNFDSMDEAEIYDNTMFFSPMQLLSAIAEENVTEEDMEEDMNFILSSISLFDSLMTTFEYTLYQLLHEKFVKKVYIYKPLSFFDNEIQYLYKKYYDVVDKIEIESGCPIHELYNKVEATTIYTPDIGFILDYVEMKVPKEKKRDQVFILLNTVNNLMYIEELDKFFYETEFYERVKKVNDVEDSFKIFPMYNFYIDTNTLDETNLYRTHDEDDDETVSEDIEEEETTDNTYKTTSDEMRLL